MSRTAARPLPTDDRHCDICVWTLESVRLCVGRQEDEHGVCDPVYCHLSLWALVWRLTWVRGKLLVIPPVIYIEEFDCYRNHLRLRCCVGAICDALSESMSVF